MICFAAARELNQLQPANECLLQLSQTLKHWTKITSLWKGHAIFFIHHNKRERGKHLKFQPQEYLVVHSDFQWQMWKISLRLWLKVGFDMGIKVTEALKATKLTITTPAKEVRVMECKMEKGKRKKNSFCIAVSNQMLL